MELSTEFHRTILVVATWVESCNLVSRSSLHTKYPPARTTYVRFRNFLAMLRTSLTFACVRFTGHYSRSNLFTASTFSRGNEILLVWKLIVNPRASIVVSQFVLFLGARIGVTPSSSCLNKRTLSEANEADGIRAVVSSSEC